MKGQDFIYRRLEGDVSRETYERLEIYVHLLQHWNRRVNLIADCETAEIWSRHIADCWQLLPLIPDNIPSVTDLGSGAGFPGLVLSIGSNRPFVLVESDKRKAAFLREAARVTAAPITILTQRAEYLTGKTALVTARATAPLVRLLSWAEPILEAGGACLFLKGRSAADEVLEAETRWRFSVRAWPSVTATGAMILQISSLMPR